MEVTNGKLIAVLVYMNLSVNADWFKVSVSVLSVSSRSKAVLRLWMIYVFLYCISYAFVRVCLCVSCCHLLGKGWPLGSHLWRLTVSLPLSHCYPETSEALDCIYFWSLHPYLLLLTKKKNKTSVGPPWVWGSGENGYFFSGSLESTGNYFMGSGEQAHSFVDLGSHAKK